MSSELVKYNQLPMNSMADLVKAGDMLAQSGMFGINNPAAGFVVAATCQQQGITLLDFQRTYHIIEGKPSMKADSMLAEFRKRGGKCRIIENSVKRAAAEFEFEGVTTTFEYTIDDALRTGDCLKKDGKTLKDIWEKRTDDMLWARLVSRSVRRLCPEIVSGLYTPEEMADFEPAVRSGNAPAAPVDVVERAKVVVPVYDDDGICPNGFGPYSGKPWGEINTEMLEKALLSSKLTDGHKEEIQLTLKGRVA